MKLDVINESYPKASFREVVLEKVEPFKDNYGHDFLRLHLKAKTCALSWTQVHLGAIKRLPGQSSLSNALNPSDHYFELVADSEGGAGVGSGPTPDVEFSLEFSPPWIKGDDSSIHHLHFADGMMAGLWWWRMYRLEINKEKQVDFKFVKRYAYVEGEIKNG